MSESKDMDLARKGELDSTKFDEFSRDAEVADLRAQVARLKDDLAYLTDLYETWDEVGVGGEQVTNLIREGRVKFHGWSSECECESERCPSCRSVTKQLRDDFRGLQSLRPFVRAGLYVHEAQKDFEETGLAEEASLLASHTEVFHREADALPDDVREWAGEGE